MTDLTRDAALALDAADPLAALRDQFQIADGLIYLDGNSLGVLPRATPARVQQVVQQEWGQGLIGSWNAAGWMALPQRVGDKIARLVGAGAGELVCADSTSVNLFKVLSAALSIAQADAPDRRVILSERSNFPTDLYVAESLARERGCTLVLPRASQWPPRPPRAPHPLGQRFGLLPHRRRCLQVSQRRRPAARRQAHRVQI
jgi:kynureninase